MPANPAGQRPALSTTAPAGSRDRGTAGIHPGELRRRTAGLVARSAEMGHRMRHNDARRVVLAYADAFDGRADGWNAWLAHRFDPTQAAAIANLGGGGLHGTA